MTIVLNATTGISTPPVTVLGDTSGSISIVAPAVAGTNTQTLLAATGTLSPFNSDTAKASTSGTSVEFTGIPNWVRRITVMLNGVSTSGGSLVQIQLGTGSTSYTTSGYVGGANVFTGSGVGTNTFTSGFVTEGTSGGITSSTVRHGIVTIALVTGNTWVASGVLQHTGTTTAGSTAGSIALAAALTAVRVTTVNGTDTFDAGNINVLYE